MALQYSGRKKGGRWGSMVWLLVKADYIANDRSFRELADLYGVSETQIAKVSKRENWPMLKKAQLDRALVKTLALDEVRKAERLTRVLEVSDQLLDQVEQAAKDLNTEQLRQVHREKVVDYAEGKNGRPVRETYTEWESLQKVEGNVDPQRVKQLVSALKELKEVQMIGGRVEADMQLRVYGPGGALMMSPCFVLTVAEAAVADSELVESQDEVTALTELVTEASGLLSVLEDAEAAASAAEQAAETAQTAASAAEQAAAQALAQAGAAETAADNANTAAQGAEAAAANAGEKAREAEAFVQTANDAVAEIRAAALETESAPPVVCEAAGAAITAADASDRLLQGLKVFGKTTQDGTPSPEEPVELESAGNGGGISVTVAGKNLLNIPQLVEKPATSYMMDLFTGTYGQSAIVPAEYLNMLPVLYPGIVYTYHFETETAGNKAVHLMPVGEDGSVSGIANDIIASNGTFTVREKTRATCRIETNLQATISNIQLEIGNQYSGYEPYKGQIVAVSTPEGLAGIPVSSGGNYTDESGQQWICDEVDLARGVHTRNIEECVVTGDENWIVSTTQTGTDGNTRFDYNIGGTPARCMNVLCTHAPCTAANPLTGIGAWANSSDSLGLRLVLPFSTVDELKAFLKAQYAAGTPVTFGYVLGLPEVTALDTETTAACAALRSNKPNTTVFNDAGAYMELQYVADTKTYIDNRFAALSNAVLSSL